MMSSWLAGLKNKSQMPSDFDQVGEVDSNELFYNGGDTDIGELLSPDFAGPTPGSSEPSSAGLLPHPDDHFARHADRDLRGPKPDKDYRYVCLVGLLFEVKVY